MDKKIIYLFAGLIIIGACSVWEFALKSQFDNRAIETNSNKNDVVATEEPSEEKKVVYLTFDDGPSVITADILDILEENDARATFFIIGNQLTDDMKDTMGRMCEKGNQLGVHTFSHEAECIYCDSDTYYNDAMKTAEAIIQYTGVVPTVFRFPWGSANCYIQSYRSEVIARLQEKGLDYCDWNVSGEDSVGNPSAAQIIANIQKNYNKYNTPVLLLHDSAGSKETANALPEIIRMYKEAGYEFGILSEREHLYQWNPDND